MANNINLRKADKNHNDEFYTQYEDIQREMNAYLEYNPNVFKDKTILLPCDDPEWSNFTRFFAQNFENFGLKKLISTSYATDSKNKNTVEQLSIFDFITDYEKSSSQYDEKKTSSHGKIYILEKDNNNSGKIDIDDLEWKYLEGDGDFRSEEIKKLRDEADIIITNPPFSLFREFVLWIFEAEKNFIIIGNQNAITYKEIFPFLKDNKMWLGLGFSGGATHFINKIYTDYATADDHQKGMIRVSGVVWFTNIEHGRRHQKLNLMSENDNLKFSKHKEIRSNGYKHFDNYNAINIPYTDAIPSDYNGLMGVPITFFDKYNPEQFEIIDGIGRYSILDNENTKKDKKYLSMIEGEAQYFRIIIRRK